MGVAAVVGRVAAVGAGEVLAAAKHQSCGHGEQKGGQPEHDVNVVFHNRVA